LIDRLEYKKPNIDRDVGFLLVWSIYEVGDRAILIKTIDLHE